MDRIRLGKVEAKFFSEKGNTLLRKIWNENDLDEEMIFSCWIGPSKALLRQKVSDYVQNYLLHRSILLAARNLKNDEENFQNPDNIFQPESFRCDKRHTYYDNYVKNTLARNCSKREKNEEMRVAKSIHCGELQTLPGFEYILKDPVFRALEMERRMKSLSKIPLPYNEDQFYQYILPMMTSKGNHKRKFKASLRDQVTKANLNDKLEIKVQLGATSTSSSEIFDYSTSLEPELINLDETDASSNKWNKGRDFESDLGIPLPLPDSGLGESQPGSSLNEGEFIKECDFCGGALISESGKRCCISSQLWNDDDDEIQRDDSKSQSASSLYEKASKILEVYIRERLISQEYMEEYYSKCWMNK